MSKPAKGGPMTPQEKEDAKVKSDLQKLARLVDSQLPYGWAFVELGAAAEDKQLGRTRQEIADLKRMLARAADALESNQIATSKSCEIFTLIAELRKAAE